MRFVKTAEGGKVSLESHFKSNYSELKRWAMQITSYDEALSDDILHDAYLKFRQQTRDASIGISDVNSYIYVALRNTYRSHLRKIHNRKTEVLSLYEIADLREAHLIYDPRLGRRQKDDLRSICQYLCSRKPASISASLMILRFFHGFFPSEVSKVANRSRNAVEARISKARREIAAFLYGGIDVETQTGSALKNSNRAREGQTELFDELRGVIFGAVEGPCVSPESLKHIYRKDNGRPDRSELSHIVSCEACLDLISVKLRISNIAERHPLDVLRPQSTVEAMQLSIDTII